MIVKIMVPFWVPIIVRGLILGTQKGTIILTIPHILRAQGLWLLPRSIENRLEKTWNMKWKLGLYAGYIKISCHKETTPPKHNPTISLSTLWVMNVARRVGVFVIRGRLHFLVESYDISCFLIVNIFLSQRKVFKTLPALYEGMPKNVPQSHHGSLSGSLDKSPLALKETHPNI